MTERHLTAVGSSEKLQTTPMPTITLAQGKYGLKLDITREGNILQRVGHWFSQVELHPVDITQVFLFAHCAVGFWSGSYAVLIRTYHEHSFLPETIGRINSAYTFFGVDGKARPKPLGVARHTSDITAYLHEKGIGIGNWFPVHQLPDHFAEVTTWTNYDIHSCLLRMSRERSHIVLVEGS